MRRKSCLKNESSAGRSTVVRVSVSFLFSKYVRGDRTPIAARGISSLDAHVQYDVSTCAWESHTGSKGPTSKWLQAGPYDYIVAGGVESRKRVGVSKRTCITWSSDPRSFIILAQKEVTVAFWEIILVNNLAANKTEHRSRTMRLVAKDDRGWADGEGAWT